MLAHELRLNYLEFFKSRTHLHLPSAPLVPVDVLGEEDKTTLFSGSGMEQFKPFFTGAATPPSRRVTTVQKCLRTVDIDSVGDYSHCTFFEMLGNFSFGDYFKADVIPWTWEFLTVLVGLDPERLCVTVYQDDDEAFAIWRDIVGLPEDRIHRLGEDKNYWPANAISQGPNGPCGPCSEIFYRVAAPEKMTTDPALTPTQRYLIDDKNGRWVEIWNNVFTQFNRSEDADGRAVLTPLPQKNNDTGAGLDRIAYVSQGKTSVFETDLFQPILSQVETLSGKTYGGTMEPLDFAFRVVAEHTRSMTFCIADGILPSNETRGYVLRYIMRRAIRYGKMVLGVDEPFLYKIAPRVVEQMGDFYHELRDRQDLIVQTIKAEEERFHRTLDNGTRRLAEMLETPRVQKAKTLSGRDAFILHDTYGFPFKLTQDMAAERGVTVDMHGFEEAMEEQRMRSREASDMGKEVFGGSVNAAAGLDVEVTFEGYQTTIVEDSLVAALLKGDAQVDVARAGDEVRIVLDRTPFYAESGGQVADTGLLTAAASGSAAPLRVEVLDVQKTGGVFVHAGKVLEGEIAVGQRVQAAVDTVRRRHIMRNHTATHLLQAALRQVLGAHVHQKGSLVTPDRLRFDFTHTQPVTAEEIRRIEEIVNGRILDDSPVIVHADMPIAEAKARGAMALFGEKYGDRVRLVEVPGFSLELCGGTHVAHTAFIGLTKVVSETGVAAGVRRIEAVTGAGAYAYTNRREETVQELASILKTGPNDLVAGVQRLIAQRQDLERQIRQLKTSGEATRQVELKPELVSGVPVVFQALEAADAETVANFADRAVQNLTSAVVVLGTVNEGKVSFTAKVTKDLVARGVHAGNLVREVARIAGGGGGGRPDFAQAGGRNPEKLQEALDAVPSIVASQIS